MLVLRMMLASAGNICFAAVVGFHWWCLNLLLMPVLGGCSDNIAVPKKTKTVKAEKSHEHIQKTQWNMQSLTQTLQNGSLGASFGHPYRKNKAFGDTLGPKTIKVGLWAAF